MRPYLLYFSGESAILKVLVIGGGGREHALAWRLAKSPSVKKVIAAPGNPGIEEVGECVPVEATDPVAVAAVAERFGVDLTVVGPEAPLVAGVVDEFRRRALKIIGPTQAAAQLEGSKIFAKQFFERAGIPTARSLQTNSGQESLDALKRFDLPVVIKADGLAAGKGVVIANSRKEAEAAVRRLGPNLVIEEFLEGEEVSFIGLSDGERVVPLAPTQDHKRIFDGDQGPNTGGMGAYCDERILTPAQTGQIMDSIMQPAIAHMKSEGNPFTGFLYAGLMMTASGPKVLEFNVRSGDPETQALMYTFDGDLGEVLMGEATPQWGAPSVCVVLAAQGYPDKPRTGDPIRGIAEAEATGATVFQAGTRKDGAGLVSNGGRVLGITAGGDTLQIAIDSAYRAAGLVHFAGMQFRRDIGQKGLGRW
jgi:phosphoribosylamine--glycine ligase